MIKLSILMLVSYSQAKNHLLCEFEAIQKPTGLPNLKKLLMGDFIPPWEVTLQNIRKLEYNIQSLVLTSEEVTFKFVGR